MVEEEEEEEEFLFLLPKDFDPRAMPTWLLPPPSAEILFRGPPNLVVSQQQQPLSSDSSLSWETFVSWPPPERRRMRRMQGRRENENENLSAIRTPLTPPFFIRNKVYFLSPLRARHAHLRYTAHLCVHLLCGRRLCISYLFFLLGLLVGGSPTGKIPRREDYS